MSAELDPTLLTLHSMRTSIVAILLWDLAVTLDCGSTLSFCMVHPDLLRPSTTPPCVRKCRRHLTIISQVEEERTILLRLTNVAPRLQVRSFEWVNSCAMCLRSGGSMAMPSSDGTQSSLDRVCRRENRNIPLK